MVPEQGYTTHALVTASLQMRTYVDLMLYVLLQTHLKSCVQMPPKNIVSI